jgi:hypothetical protein
VLEVFILLQCKTTPRIRPTKTRNGMYGWGIIFFTR